jgi:hypothetical protein
MDATPNEQLDERTARRKRQNVQRVLRCRKRKQAGSRCVRIEVTDWAETLNGSPTSYSGLSKKGVGPFGKGVGCS